MLGVGGAAGRGKFGRRFLMRGSLSSKMGNENYYKGRGGRKEGTHTNKGGYVVRPERMMRIVAPDLTGFELKPYVHTITPRPKKGERVPAYVAAPAATAAEGGSKELA